MKKTGDYFKPYAFIGTKAVIINNNKVLLLRRSGKVDDSGKWSLPGGRLEPGEEVLAGMIREIKEETGLVVDDLELIDVKSFDEKLGFVVIIFYAGKIEQEEIALDWENDDYKWVRLDEIDGLTVDSLLKEIVVKGIKQIKKHN